MKCVLDVLPARRMSPQSSSHWSLLHEYTRWNTGIVYCVFLEPKTSRNILCSVSKSASQDAIAWLASHCTRETHPYRVRCRRRGACLPNSRACHAREWEAPVSDRGNRRRESRAGAPRFRAGSRPTSRGRSLAWSRGCPRTPGSASSFPRIAPCSSGACR